MIDRNTDIKAALRSRQRGFLLNPFRFGGGGGGGGDPHFSNVSLLLHMDGASGSTTFTDSGPLANVVTPNGGVQISTAQSMFGGASAQFDGSGDFLTLNGSGAFAFGTGDFTIEMWVRFTALSYTTLIDFTQSGGGNARQSINIDSDYLSYVSNFNTLIFRWHGIPLNAWRHIALVRSSGSTRLFIGGVLTDTVPDASNYGVGANRPVIGARGDSTSSNQMNGYMDEIRVTKGVARYTATFTPQTDPFPNS